MAMKQKTLVNFCHPLILRNFTAVCCLLVRGKNRSVFFFLLVMGGQLKFWPKIHQSPEQQLSLSLLTLHHPCSESHFSVHLGFCFNEFLAGWPGPHKTCMEGPTTFQVGSISHTTDRVLLLLFLFYFVFHLTDDWTVLTTDGPTTPYFLFSIYVLLFSFFFFSFFAVTREKR